MRHLRAATTSVLHANWREGRTADGTAFAYTCPDPRKYPDQFYWDSCLHALAWSRVDPARAGRELGTLLSAAAEDGHIGHTVFWRGPVRWQRAAVYNLRRRRDLMTGTIQPPLLAWVWALLAARGGPAPSPLQIEVLVRHMGWLTQARAQPDGLIGILQPDESGLDATPAYDAPLGWRAHGHPGFVALMRANRARGFSYRAAVRDGAFHATDVLVNTGWVLGWHGLAALGIAGASARAARLTDALVARMWSPQDGLFYAEGPDGRPLRVSTWAGLAPLALPGLPHHIARRLVEEHLLSARRYWLPFPVPSVSAEEPSFRPGETGFPVRRYWRGPTWLFCVPFLLRGLVRHGYGAQAEELAARTRRLVAREGLREYFHPHSGAGMGARTFAVSALALEAQELLNEPAAGLGAL